MNCVNEELIKVCANLHQSSISPPTLLAPDREWVEEEEEDRQPSFSGEDGRSDNGDQHRHRRDQGTTEWKSRQLGIVYERHEQQTEGWFEFQTLKML